MVPSGGAQTSEDIELDRQAGKFELKPDHSLSGANCGEDSLEKEMATQSSILPWKIPWAEEAGGIQSTGSQSVRHD